MAQLRTAERYYAFSARLAERAALQAVRSSSLTAAAATVVAHQASQASEASAAATAMLLEQGIRESPDAVVVPTAFTTAPATVAAMLEQAEVDWQFARIVRGLVQDAGRAAQSVDAVARRHVSHVRHLNPPSCSRCAVLAGRVYRWSEGFQRHPGCDCTMVPVTSASSDLTYDPAEMARNGQIRGLSKADTRALADGADLGQIVNVRRQRATGGLSDAGDVLRRNGRLTPAGIYRQADTREEALDLLKASGYLR